MPPSYGKYVQILTYEYRYAFRKYVEVYLLAFFNQFHVEGLKVKVSVFRKAERSDDVSSV